MHSKWKKSEWSVNLAKDHLFILFTRYSIATSVEKYRVKLWKKKNTQNHNYFQENELFNGFFVFGFELDIWAHVWCAFNEWVVGVRLHWITD